MVEWWFGMPPIVRAIVARHVDGSALAFGAAATVLPAVVLYDGRTYYIPRGSDVISSGRRPPVSFGYRFAGRDSRGVVFRSGLFVSY
jgi:hypothetical protein